MVTTRSSSRLRVKITSAETVANNEDLLQEILLRLPTKTLLKFKLVSKPWLSLISSTHFSLSHTRFLQNNHSLKPHALFLDILYEKLPSKFMFLHLNPDINPLPSFNFIDVRCVKIIQSCIGLLLCVSVSDDGLRFFVCNPTTKKFNVISIPSRQEIYNSYDYVANSFVNMIALIWRLIHTNHLIFSIWREVLFSKDPENTTFYIFPRYSVDIYSSETNSWSVSKIEFNSKQYIHADHAVFFNGAIHWDCSDTQSWYIDVNNECLKTMPMPRVNKGYRYFGESGGHLHLAVATEFSHLEFTIFEMEADYSSWSSKYNETLLVVPRRRSRIQSYLLSYAIQCNEKQGDSIVIALSNGKGYSYNLESGTVQKLWCSNVKKYEHDHTSRFHALQYFESLSCI
ncbi:hypothetical protein QUC31_010011 [Theobroma cacao]